MGLFRPFNGSVPNTITVSRPGAEFEAPSNDASPAVTCTAFLSR